MRQKIKTEKKINICGIDVTLTKKTNMKRLYIKIKPPEADVYISAPNSMNEKEIVDFFISKIEFVKKSISDIKNRHIKSVKKYVDGEFHYLWGEPYNLKILDGKNNVKIEGDSIYLYTENQRPEAIKKLLDEFYRYELREELNHCLNEAEELTNIKSKEIRIRNMKTNWGSCNIQKKRIWVSLNLAKYPKICLIYILVHELTHLKERNHNKRFYELLDSAFDKRKECDLILKEIL